MGRDIHQSHKILTAGLCFTVMDLLRSFKVLQEKKIFLRGREGKGNGDTIVIPARGDGKFMSIPDWICTCKNPILYDSTTFWSCFKAVPEGKRNRPFQVNLKIIATAISLAF